MSILDFITTLFAPDDCLGCGREGALLCKVCLPQLPAVPGRCYGCSKEVNGVTCNDCLSQTNLHQIVAATQYVGESKQLVARLKFDGNQSAARYIAKAIAPLLQPDSNTIVTFVPATPGHVRQRGYDQAELIIKEVSRLLHIPRATLLRRNGSAHQLGASRVQRRQQLLGALRVARGATIMGKHIVLIDDVLTTGSSLAVAAQVLQAAGATRIDGVVFAQAIKNTP